MKSESRRGVICGEAEAYRGETTTENIMKKKKKIIQKINNRMKMLNDNQSTLRKHHGGVWLKIS
jgi:MOSC domain-containing protein YiiM